MTYGYCALSRHTSTSTYYVSVGSTCVDVRCVCEKLCKYLTNAHNFPYDQTNRGQFCYTQSTAGDSKSDLFGKN
jgi:hypothetical protein